MYYLPGTVLDTGDMVMIRTDEIHTHIGQHPDSDKMMIGSTRLSGSGVSLCRIQEQDCPLGRITADMEQEGTADSPWLGSHGWGVFVCVYVYTGGLLGFLSLLFYCL